MKTKFTIMLALAGALALPAFSFAKEHDEEKIEASAVPAVVMKAAENEAKGGKIVSWEKEDGKYEAKIEKDGKEWEVTIDAKGQVLKKESEEGEEHEKGEKK